MVTTIYVHIFPRSHILDEIRRLGRHAVRRHEARSYIHAPEFKPCLGPRSPDSDMVNSTRLAGILLPLFFFTKFDYFRAGKIDL